MNTKPRRFLAWLVWSLLAAAILLAGTGAALAAGEIGKTIDKSNVQEYKDILIPHTYRAVERGDFILKTANLPYQYTLGEKFLAASERNAGKFDVNAEGDLIDKSGKIPFYNVYGLPFPHIDRNDPHIAVKIMWNFHFKTYRFMGSVNGTHVSWKDEKLGEHRWLEGDEILHWLTGRPPGQEIKRNASGFVYLELQHVMAPMSIRGTNSMAWDYLDERDISQYAYIPAFRRVRQTSGASRSDSYQGTDMWMDIGNGWAGKNRTMTWKLVGEKTVLVPFTTLQKQMLEVLADGTVMTRPPVIKFGYETPGWKGCRGRPRALLGFPERSGLSRSFRKTPITPGVCT